MLKRQYNQIEHLFPKQRGNVEYSNLQVLNAMLYMPENGCKWRTLPRRRGKWNSIYKHVNRWAKNGILVQVFEYLHEARITDMGIEALCLDSTIGMVHPDGTGALKKRKAVHRKIPWRLDDKIHMLCANERLAVSFHLSGGQCHDAPEGRKLLENTGPVDTPISLLMDRAYEGENMRDTALELGYSLCVPPKSNRKKFLGL